MRSHIRKFVALIEDIFDLPEPIYEFGAFQVPHQEGSADLRTLFPGKSYVGCDIREGRGVDRIEDVSLLALPQESVGTVIFVETIEHVQRPQKAIEEIHRVLKNDGVLVMTSAMDLEIHDFPQDYWRFTPGGFRQLLSCFPKAIVGSGGYGVFPHTVMGIGFKDPSKDINLLYRELASRGKSEITTGNAPGPYVKKSLQLLIHFSPLNKRTFLKKYLALDEIHFELIDDKTGAPCV